MKKIALRIYYFYMVIYCFRNWNWCCSNQSFKPSIRDLFIILFLIYVVYVS